ncbi:MULTISPECIES: FAD-dependent monooxygenase [unclassified Nocardioides]|uniref:FAD-dependent monooxygenase n=1 Tax=unclassified Nocardioides TaxID=2615069 RepID=UPI0009EF9CC1|nr:MULTISPECIES: FAD-dependent monooxygenase [unclassified Nocardioides]GAW48907.1 monooxygenase [Nocardioides sp. PD653-B2]GAW54544.1 monooxygenase [Nocardioides sp. PD653]
MGAYDGPPVVVIGNGPVGQTTALLLARWGIPAVVLDAHPQRTIEGSRSICQQRDTLEVWDSVGAGRQIADEGVTWRVARTYFREHELFHVEFSDASGSPFPPWVNIAQSRVEELLDERIAETPSIEVRWGHRVTGLRDLGDRVVVAADTADGPVRLETPYVVACAGARGDVVRDALGLSFDGRSFDDRFLICDIRCELPDRTLERRFHFDPEWNPGRQVLIHPCPDSVFRIDWQVEPGFDLAAEQASGALDARIRQVVGERAFEVVWCTVYRFHSRSVDRMAVGRVLLAGDVAHLMAPFGARGLNSGVADAENAAWKLAFALHGWADGSLVASYDAERGAAARANLAVTSRTMDFLVPQTEEGRLHRRDVLERALADPAARGAIDSGTLYAAHRYAGSPRPPVADGRLRALARDGLLLLAAGELGPPATDVPCAVATDLDLPPGEVWLVRPDAHVAAVVDAGSVGDAVRDLLGR